MSRLLLLPLLLFSLHSAAMTPGELVRRGELRAAVIVESSPPLLQRAPLIVAVEIATPRWFSRGTRVADFRVPGALVRPVSEFADNQTRRIDGQSWTVQRWRYRIYAQDSGPLSLPRLSVFVSVNTENDGTVEGSIELAAPTLDIVAPEGGELIAHWLATPQLEIRESWEGLLDEYRPGDAITRVRQYRVEDAPAMMLAGDSTADIPGLSLYRAPAEVRDRSNRGLLIGERRERLVITMEQPGDYELPGLEYSWFNLRSGAFETLRIDPMRFTVRGATGEQQAAREIRSSAGKPGLTPLLATLLLVVLLWLGSRSRYLRAFGRLLVDLMENLRRRRQYLRAVRHADSVSALRALDWALHRRTGLRLRDAVAGDRSAQSSLELLLAHAYGDGSKLPDTPDAARLWALVDSKPRRKRQGAALRLNPR